MTKLNNILSLKDFSYEFPSHLLAQEPLVDRDHSRLLVRSKKGKIEHSRVDSLGNFLPSNALLVVNDTRVFASRIMGHLKDGSALEVFLLSKPEIVSATLQAPCFVRPARKVEEGTVIELDGNRFAKVLKKPQKGDMSPLQIEFSNTGMDFSEWLGEHAFVPLPPYIKRDAALPWNKSSDAKRYQTVYANTEGSVAAPTAGLHFTKCLFEKLSEKGIQISPITLHVGAGTFLPVKTDIVSEHAMHKERYSIPSSTWKNIREAKEACRPIVAVGTTSFRCVESFLRHSKEDKDLDRWLETDLFVYPNTSHDLYHSQIFNGIITNFHQPCSTLFMLVCALIGFHETHYLYKEAVQEQYRLFSYGDTSLLWFS